MCKEINSINGLVFSFRFNDGFSNLNIQSGLLPRLALFKTSTLARLQRVKVAVLNEARRGNSPNCIFRFEKTSLNRNENTKPLIEFISSHIYLSNTYLIFSS